MPNHNAPAIANEFLDRARSTEVLPHMKLQKLVYIAHGWTLAITDQPLIADKIEAWDNGPVVPYLFRQYRYGPLDGNGCLASSAGQKVQASLTKEEKDIVDAVWKRYGTYSANELSDMTHQPGTPWTKTYVTQGRNGLIPDAMIRQHYTSLGRAGRAE